MRKSTSIISLIEIQSYAPIYDGCFGAPLFCLTTYRAVERQYDGVLVLVWETTERGRERMNYRQIRAEQQATGCRVGGIHGQVVSYDEAVDCVGERSVRYLMDSGFTFDS